MNISWSTIPADEIITSTANSLTQNGFTTTVVDNKELAKEKILALLPNGGEVMTMTSRTLDSLSILDEINESGKYTSVKKQLSSMNRETQGMEMQKLGTAPEWAIGSVHAVTQDGKVVIASNTGSQLPAYVYGSSHVIWVVGAQKIVQNVDEGIKRIYEYILPLESERINKVYNTTMGSFVSKLLIFNREIVKDRIHVILVKESLGF